MIRFASLMVRILFLVLISTIDSRRSMTPLEDKLLKDVGKQDERY
jgi:hypothetical protein